MKFFVTGASGLLGQSVLGSLIEHDHDVRAFLHDESFEQLDLATSEVVWGDLNVSSTYADYLKDCDGVIHCAWDKGHGRLSRTEYISRNVEQTVNLFHNAQKSGVNHFVMLSSLEVYGYEGGDDDYSEGAQIQVDQESLGTFAYTKSLCEKELCSLVSQSTMQLSIIRMGQLYSDSCPPVNPPSVGKYSFFAGFGNNHLPYVHVDGVAQLVMKVLTSSSGEDIEIINAAPAHSDTARAVLRRWKKSHKTPGRVIYLPIPCYKVLGTCGSFVKKIVHPRRVNDPTSIEVDVLSRNVGYSTTYAYDKYEWIGY